MKSSLVDLNAQQGQLMVVVRGTTRPTGFNTGYVQHWTIANLAAQETLGRLRPRATGTTPKDIRPCCGAENLIESIGEVWAQRWRWK